MPLQWKPLMSKTTANVVLSSIKETILQVSYSLSRTRNNQIIGIFRKMDGQTRWTAEDFNWIACAWWGSSMLESLFQNVMSQGAHQPYRWCIEWWRTDGRVRHPLTDHAGSQPFDHVKLNCLIILILNGKVDNASNVTAVYHRSVVFGFADDSDIFKFEMQLRKSDCTLWCYLWMIIWWQF